MDRKVLTAVFVVGLVATMAGAGIYAYFSDTGTSTGNVFTAGTLDITMTETASWAFPLTNMKPGDSTGDMKIDLVTVGSITPNHIEIDIDTHDFVGWDGESGGTNTADDFKKQIKVDKLTYINTGTVDLLTYVDDSADGNPEFISLYDVEVYGVFDGDDISELTLTGSGDFIVELSLPTDLPDADDNKYQGDSIQIDFEFGAVQISGQDVLT